MGSSWQMVTGTGSFRTATEPPPHLGANGMKFNESLEDDGMKEILMSYVFFVLFFHFIHINLQHLFCFPPKRYVIQCLRILFFLYFKIFNQMVLPVFCAFFHSRSKKLSDLRTLFYQSYWAEVGLTNNPTGMARFMNSFVGRLQL